MVLDNFQGKVTTRLAICELEIVAELKQDRRWNRHLIFKIFATLM